MPGHVVRYGFTNIWSVRVGLRLRLLMVIGLLRLHLLWLWLWLWRRVQPPFRGLAHG